VRDEAGNTVQTALDRLRALAARIPVIESTYPLLEPSFAPGAPPDEVDALEATLAARLPGDYRRFLLLCSRVDAMDVWNGYAVHSPAQVQRILAAREVADRYGGEKLVPVASDGGGNLFFMTLPSGQILKWRQLVSTSPFIEVASSFTGFLERMADDWFHFIEDDREWQYMAE
jgi:cell wall assembly regulator SMI1